MSQCRNSTHRRTHPVGQTMVLFAVTMLFLALTVLTTLSFATKVKDKIELQNLADASAYSNAVATSRAFNNIAVVNRAQIAHMVTVMGIQSEISFSSMGLAGLYSAELSYSAMRAPFISQFGLPACQLCYGPCWGGVCPCVNYPQRVLAAIVAYIQGLELAGEAQMIGPDFTAGLAAFLHQTVANVLMYLDEVSTLSSVEGNVGSQSFASKIETNAAQGITAANRSELTAPGGAGAVSARELNGGGDCGGPGAACDFAFDIGHVTNAAMGSRGYQWVTQRIAFLDAASVDAYLAASLLPGLALPAISPSVGISTILFNTGSGYLSYYRQWEWPPLPPYAGYARGEDYGVTLTAFTYAPGTPFVTANPPPLGAYTDPLCYGFPLGGVNTATSNAFVKGGIPIGPGAMHAWGSAGGVDAYLGDFTGVGFSNQDTSPLAHFLTPCANLSATGCPGVWPPFIDYNNFKVTNQADNFGQPKNVSALVRDAKQRTQHDPFDLLFNFKFGSANAGKAYAGGRGLITAGTVIDPNGTYLANGTDISSQIAMAHGIAYFHRANHWAEPPNLLNPFWRATLVASDTDQQGVSGVLGGGNDVVNTLLAVPGSGQAIQTLNELQLNGFKGIQ